MKVLGICGSPRKGNTEWMLKTLLQSAGEAGADTELILLRETHIKGCDGCLSCEAGGQSRKGLCRIQDDMQSIYPRLLKCYALVLGTPVYFEMLSGLLKNFLDRTCPIWPRLEGKKLAGIAVAEGGVGKAIDNLRTYGAVCGMNWVGEVTALARNPRQASKDKDLAAQLQDLGKKVASCLNES